MGTTLCSSCSAEMQSENPWEYDKELYKKRNEVERFFRRLKAYRGIATRYDKLDLMFTAFIWIACICIFLTLYEHALRVCTYFWLGFCVQYCYGQGNIMQAF